jgi:hypothetical protein
MHHVEEMGEIIYHAATWVAEIMGASVPTSENFRGGE